MFLPPEVLLHTRAKAAQGIVRVHHNMDNGVDQSSQDSCTGGGVCVCECVCVCVCIYMDVYRFMGGK